jgi:HlyD family secretion protein
MKTAESGTILSMLLCSCVASILLTLLSSTPVFAQASQQASVSALGRLEPEHGIVGIGAPSTPEALSGSLMKSIHVKEGDQVKTGQLLAITASESVLLASKEHAVFEHQAAELAASASKSEAEEACVLADVANREAERRVRLLEQKLASEEETETAQGKAEATRASCTSAHARARFSNSKVRVAASRIDVADAELERAYIKAPFNGRVLDILIRPGEFIGAEAFLELGRTDKMYAIAEVYETDIRRVKVGQTASISSAALTETLYGKVEMINYKVEKQDVTGTDPAANKDARIIEVKILLDRPELAASLTHLQVEIIIDN